MHTLRRWLSVLAAVIVLWLAPGVAAQQFDGPELAVNTYTTGRQIGPRVAHQPDGSFIVVWYGIGPGDSNGGVFARRYDAAGAPQGAQFRVSTYTPMGQSHPSPAAIGAGDFIVVWVSDGQDSGTLGTYAQRISGTGALLGSEFRVNTYTSGFQVSARVAGSASGFAVVWQSQGQDGDLSGIFGQCFTAAGAPVGSEFRINSYTTYIQHSPSVAMDAAGNFAAVWTDASRYHTYGQRFASDCSPAGGEFLAHPGVDGRIGMDAAGNFVVAATSDDLDGYGLSARRFSSSGVEQGSEFQVNSYTTGSQVFMELAVAPSGEFVVTWQTDNPATDLLEYVWARAFEADGTPTSADFVVKAESTNIGPPSYPFASMAADGRFVLVWRSESDGCDYGIAAQRLLHTDVIFADGFESGDLSAWSSSQADGGDLSVSGPAALNSTTTGLQGLVDDNTGLYVQDDSPNDENVYRARFYFDTNGFDPGETQDRRRVRLFIAFEETPTRRLMAIVLRRLEGVYGLMGQARLDDNSQYDTGFTTISDGSHFVELAWKRASGPDANDGEFQLWIDGASVHSNATLDNSISAVDFARLGALSVKVGATGTLFWDEFVSRRMDSIGP